MCVCCCVNVLLLRLLSSIELLKNLNLKINLIDFFSASKIVKQTFNIYVLQ